MGRRTRVAGGVGRGSLPNETLFLGAGDVRHQLVPGRPRDGHRYSFLIGFPHPLSSKMPTRPGVESTHLALFPSSSLCSLNFFEYLRHLLLALDANGIK